MNSSPITILGAGSWGTALAIRLATDHETCLWGHEPDFMAKLASDRENRQFLPGAMFPDKLCIESVLERAVRKSGDLLLAVPSHAFREVLENAMSAFSKNTRIAWATKGLEQGSGKFMGDIVDEVLGIKNFMNDEFVSCEAHVEEALMRLTEAYMSLGIKAEAQAAAAVLGHNFPNSKWYKDAYVLLKTDGLEPRESAGSWLGRAWQKISPL